MKSILTKSPPQCPMHRLAELWSSWQNKFSTVTEKKLKTLRCPMGHGAKNQESVFIEQAEKAATNAPILPGDPAANDLLQEARDAIYHWPEDFAGFQATLSYRTGANLWESDLVAHSSRRYEFALKNCPDEKWVRYQIEELLAHREAPKKSRMASQSGVLLGDHDLIYGQKIIFAGDKMGSYYRLKDQKIMQIHRAYGGQSFVINIDQHAIFDHKFAAQAYTAFYRDSASDNLTKVETYLDMYQPIEGVFLPTERRFTEAVGSTLTHRSIRFDNLIFLRPNSS